jgi:hypothetical protein
MSTFLKSIKITSYCLAAFVVVILGINTNAQPALPIIYSHVLHIHNASWSSDGALFTFQLGTYINYDLILGVNTPEFESWFAYDANQEGLSSKGATTWRQYEKLASHLSAQITLATHPDGAISFIFPSPNERYVVYAAPRQRGDPFGYALAVTDVITRYTSIISNVRTVYLSDFTNFYNVIWSAGSTAFVVQHDSGFAADITTYVSDNAADFNPAKIVDLSRIDINGRSLETSREFAAISEDGKKVALSVRANVNESYLLIWNSKDIVSSQFIPTGQYYYPVVAAAFVNGDQVVLYISEEGLMKYELATQETVLIDASINSTWVDKAWFSPTGKQIALLDSAALPSEKNTLYMYDIPSLK